MSFQKYFNEGKRPIFLKKSFFIIDIYEVKPGDRNTFNYDWSLFLHSSFQELLTLAIFANMCHLSAFQFGQYCPLC